MPLRMALVAGEASGDLLASLLIDGLRARFGQDVVLFGIGGPRMRAQGFVAWWDCAQLAVRGYVEVLWHYREIVGIRAQLRERLLADPPDVFIGVDAPDFNLALAKSLKERGIKAVQFVSPSLWAWRPERIDTIKASVDHVLCLFPFEPALYAKAGVAATYVGHPLAQVIPMQPDQPDSNVRDTARADLARVHAGLGAARSIVAVLPGSRRSEIKYMAKTFVQTAKRLLAADEQLHVVIPAATGLIEAIAKVLVPHPRLHLVQGQGQSHTVLAACDVALVASGTATLEAALFQRPMVVAYKMNALSWWWMRRQRLQPWVGLPNILCQDFVCPEFLQGAATPQALADALLAQLRDANGQARIKARFAALHHELLRDTPRLAAEVIAHLVGTSRARRRR